MIGLLVGAAVLALFLVQPSQAIKERTFGGSYVLNNDSGGPVVVDLASGRPTIRLVELQSNVHAASPSDLDVSPLSDGWLLLNSTTGNINFLDRDNLVLGPASGLDLPGVTSVNAGAIRDGADAFVIRSSGTESDVVEVSRSNVYLAEELSGAGANGAHVHVAEAAVPPILTTPGAATASHGDLWAIAAKASGKGDQLLLFHSASGAHPSLATKALGSVSSTAVVATDTATGRVVLASANDIRSVGTDGTGTRAPLRPHGAVLSILPVQGTGTTQWFLYRQAGTWREVGFDTVTHRVVADRLVTGLHAPDLLSPVSSGGELYALNSDAPAGGQTKDPPVLVSIALGTAVARPIAVPGDGSGAYPEVQGEQPNFSDESVVLTGPRVIFNNPDSELAVMLFLGGRRPPRVIDKFAATTVQPGSLLTGLQPAKPTPQSQQPQTPAAPAPAPQQVDQNQSCKSSTESPHVPTINPLQPGATSVLVSWTYPLLDAQDCQPSTWEVDVTPLNGATSPPNDPFYINNAVTQFQVSGLESQSQYQVVVTAFINKQSTSSLPASFTTLAGAPTAPTNVTTTATGSGWNVSWAPCTGSHCGEPVAFWNVTSTPCGSSVVISPPDATGQASTATSVMIPFSSGAGPGTSLTFDVAAGGADGSIGATAGDGTCTEGWSQPDASQLHFSATYPNPNSNQVVLSVSPPPSPSTYAIYGSADTSFSFSLVDNSDPSGSQQPPATSSPSVTLNLVTGDSYTADVTVTPTVQPGEAVQLPSVPVAYNSPWPDMSVTATAAHGPAYDAQSGENVMTATVTVANAFANNPNNLPLTLSASGSVACAGNSYSPISSVPVNRSGPFGLNGVFAVSYPQPIAGPPPAIANCSITNLTLTETDSDNVHTPTSPTLDSPPFASGTEAFSAAFAQTGGAVSGIVVSINGTGGLNTVAAQLGGSVAPPGAGGGACADQEIARNGGVVGSACVTQLQRFANQNDVAVTWSPSLVLSWQDAAGPYSEAVAVPCGGACPSFTSTVPVVTAVSPKSGTSATPVTISGTNFGAGATVEFEGLTRGAATSVKVVNSGTITCYPPAGLTGTVNVIVTVNGQSSAVTAGDRFTYLSG